MNIGIDVRKLHDYGIGTHIRNVILPAARQARSYRFYLYCDPRDTVVENGHLTWVPERSSKYSVREQIALSRQAAKHRIDLFHAPHYTLPLHLGCATIVTVHDLIHLKFAEYFPYWKVKAAEFVLRRAIRKAAVVITVSETSKEDILHYFPAAEGKIEVLYNRLSDEWLQPAPEVDLRRLGIEGEFLLYVGNFKRHKGVETLVEAYHRWKDAPPLVLVGNSGTVEPELAEKIFSTRGIRLLGFSEGGLLRRLYAEATLFVFPSLYEGFGYPPLEAISSGTPVLSSDAPALREILADGAEYFERGNVEDLAEKLRILLGDRERLAYLKQAGLERSRKFIGEESSRRLLAIYRRLLSCE